MVPTTYEYVHTCNKCQCCGSGSEVLHLGSRVENILNPDPHKRII
jgi:hypothetical protein